MPFLCYTLSFPSASFSFYETTYQEALPLSRRHLTTKEINGFGEEYVVAEDKIDLSRISAPGASSWRRSLVPCFLVLVYILVLKNVLNSRRIMRGYHIRIRVTVKPATKSPAKATTWAADTFIPKSVFENLPAHTPRETSRNNAILGSKRRDYRYGPIRIDWLDLKSSPPTTSSIEKPLKKPKGGIERVTMDNAPTMSASGNGKEKDTRNRSEGICRPGFLGLTLSLGGPIVGKFVPKPDKTKVEDCPDQPHGSTNLPEGIVHIFRDPPPRANVGTQDEALTNDENNTELGADDNTLAVLAVPSWMTPADFLSFVEPAADSIVHLRMIR
jgi:BRCA1-associated protein